MVNGIVECSIREECETFIKKITQNEAAIRKLASSHHPDGEDCTVFGRARGSFNYCLFVKFDPSGIRWVVRIPLIPRLAFVHEKLDAEIATMKYPTLKTTIPIPTVHAYSIQKDNPIGLPYMILDYKEGKTLFEKSHLLEQVADIFLQLRQQEFSSIGTLSLRTFDVTNRPCSVEANGQEIEGLDASSIWKPGIVYRSARDYCNSIMELAMNDFTKAKNAVCNKADAGQSIYCLDRFLDFLQNWFDEDLEKGPFVLTHGDFRPVNLLVDPNTLDLVAILDWEWSSVVPLQIFTPPMWLTWRTLPFLCRLTAYREYEKDLGVFLDILKEREAKTFPRNPDRFCLSREWARINVKGSVLVAAALRDPIAISQVYEFLERCFLRRGEDLRTPLAKFLDSTPSRRDLVARKLQDLEDYKRELQLLKGSSSDPEDGVSAPQAASSSWLNEHLANLSASKFVLNWSRFFISSNIFGSQITVTLILLSVTALLTGRQLTRLLSR